MPWVPTYQSQAPWFGLKFTKKETPTLRWGSYDNQIGSNRSSSKADIKVYLGRTFASFQDALKVPMHPLSYPSSIHVTKMGTLISPMFPGNQGRVFLLSLASNTSKQYLQCSSVAFTSACMILFIQLFISNNSKMGAECRTCAETILSSRSTEANLPTNFQYTKNNLEPNCFYSQRAREIIKKIGMFEIPSCSQAGLIHVGPLELEDGKKYQGQMLNGKRHGKGKQVWEDSSLYEGQWSNGLANGKGRLIQADGDVYEGEWKDDKFSGHGTYFYADGSSYTGQWENDMQNGYGICKSSDGSVYYGYHKNGKKHGKGKLTWPDGSWFEGNFEEDVIQGKGKFVWPNKKEYEGQWKNNKMHGKGKFLWPDGRRYEGGYFNDLKNGYGQMFWPDGKAYQGQWKDGFQSGNGMYRNKQGIWRKGVWLNGKLIEE